MYCDIYVNSSSLYHTIVQRDQDPMHILQNIVIRLALCYLDMMSKKQHVGNFDKTKQNKLMQSRNRSLKPMKIQELPLSVRCLWVQRIGICQDMPSITKDKVLQLGSPVTMKETQPLFGFLRLWRQHIPHLGILLLLIYS